LKNSHITYLLFLLMPVFIFVYHPAKAQTDPPQPGTVPQKKINPRSAKEQLAMSYYRKKEFDKAGEIYEQLHNENPRQFYYAYLLNCYLNLKDYKQADKLIKKVRRKDPANYRYKVDQAYLFKVTGNEKKSKKILEDLITNLPPSKSLIIQIASALQTKGFFEEALLVYENAKSLPSSNYSYNLEIATAFQYTGDYDRMFNALLEHVEANPADAQRVKNRMQSLIRRDVDDNLSGLLKTKLLERVQENPETLIYAEMLLWYSLQTKDFDMAFRQARAIDMRFHEREEDVLEVADIAFSNKQYELSAKAYGYVKDKKEDTPYYFDSYTGYYLEMGITKGSVEIIGNLTHITAFKLGNYEEAKILLEQALAIPNLSQAEIALLKLELADILLFTEEVWDATLLYSQIESEMKNEPLGHEAKFRNAQLFYFIGEFGWAQTKLDILKSATSKLIANDALELSLFIKDLLGEDTLGLLLKMFGKADMLIYREKYDSATRWYEKIEQEPGGTNTYQYLLYKKAGLMVNKQDYQQADSLYNYLAIYNPTGIKADNALFKRAEINRLYLENEELAKDLYMQLMRDYPESIYAGEARIRFRALREGGDG